MSNNKTSDSLTYPDYSPSQRHKILFLNGVSLGFLGYVVLVVNITGNVSLVGSMVGMLTGTSFMYTFDKILYIWLVKGRKDMNSLINIPSLNLDKPLRKHTSFIHVDTDLHPNELKLQNILYKTVYDSVDKNSTYFYIKRADINDYLGCKKMKRDELEINLKNLVKSVISWNILGQDQKNTKVWEKLACGGAGMIASFLIDEFGGFVRFEVCQSVKDMIREPNIYAKLDLRIQKKLKSKYQIKLYELLIDELTRSRQNKTTTRWYYVDELKRLFGLQPNMYDEIKSLNQCIKKAIDELNEKTDLYIKLLPPETQPGRRGRRKIIAHRFEASYKVEIVSEPCLDLGLGGDDDYDPIDPYISKIKDTDIDTDMDDDNIIERLMQIFNNRETAQQIYDETKNKYQKADINEEYIDQNIFYAKKHHSKENGNLLGYMRKAIESDYAGYIKTQEELAIRERQRKENETIKKEDAVKQEEQDRIYNEREAEFLRLPEEERNIWFNKTGEKHPHLKHTDNNSAMKLSITVTLYFDFQSAHREERH